MLHRNAHAHLSRCGTLDTWQYNYHRPTQRLVMPTTSTSTPPRTTGWTCAATWIRRLPPTGWSMASPSWAGSWIPGAAGPDAGGPGPVAPVVSRLPDSQRHRSCAVGWGGDLLHPDRSLPGCLVLDQALPLPPAVRPLLPDLAGDRA